MTDKFDFQWCLGSAALINCRASCRSHFFKGSVCLNVLQSTKLGSYSSLKGRKAFSISQKSHYEFFSPFLSDVLLSGSEKMTGLLEPLISIQKLKRDDTTKYVLGEKHKKCRKHPKNVQNTGKTQSLWNVFASVSRSSGELTPPF